MTYVAWRELGAGPVLKKLDPAAPRRLAINQLVLSGMLVVYFGWALYQDLSGPAVSAQILLKPDVQGMFGNIDQISREITIWMYIGLMAASLFARGHCLVLLREKLLQKYLATTPKWIIDYQRGEERFELAELNALCTTGFPTRAPHAIESPPGDSTQELPAQNGNSSQISNSGRWDVRDVLLRILR